MTNGDDPTRCSGGNVSPLFSCPGFLPAANRGHRVQRAVSLGPSPRPRGASQQRRWGWALESEPARSVLAAPLWPAPATCPSFIFMSTPFVLKSR